MPLLLNNTRKEIGFTLDGGKAVYLSGKGARNGDFQEDRVTVTDEELKTETVQQMLNASPVPLLFVEADPPKSATPPTIDGMVPTSEEPPKKAKK